MTEGREACRTTIETSAPKIKTYSEALDAYKTLNINAGIKPKGVPDAIKAVTAAATFAKDPEKWLGETEEKLADEEQRMEKATRALEATDLALYAVYDQVSIGKYIELTENDGKRALIMTHTLF